MHALLSQCNVRTITPADIDCLYPDMLSFKDLDTAEEYQAAQCLSERVHHQDKVG